LQQDLSLELNLFSISDAALALGLQYATTEVQNQSRRPTVLPQPTLRDLYDELTQLQQEFVKVTNDPKHHLLAVVTDSIELEDVYLGEFCLELHLDRLREHTDVSAFDVVALDPHPPDSSQDVTHPHVRDNQLCAGDAILPKLLQVRRN
jgi:hypothetical protein